MQVLAIDQGTTSTKALLVADDGSARLLGSLPHRQIHPAPGLVEQDAAELLRNVEDLLALGIDAGATALALANQGETVVAWDRATGRPLCNAIVWQDQRTTDQVEALRATGAETVVTERSGLPLDAYFSATKLRWILDHVPEARQLLRSGRLGLGTSDAWFIERLTGRYVTDVTTAARSSLMNLDQCAWDPVLCDIFGIPAETLPDIVECDTTLGSASGIPLEASLVDQISALHGHGCAVPGDAKVTLGTGAFALTVTEGRSHLPGVVSALGWRGPKGRVHAADGGVYSAGAAVEWLVRLKLLATARDLDGLAGPPAAARGVFFVPALTGLACPHWDRSAAGLWIGLDISTDRDDLVKSVLEGVAFRVAEVLDALGARTGGVLSIDGGLCRSRYFRAFLASVLGRGLFLPATEEITALGAALLAGRGAIPARQDGTRIAAGSADPSWREGFARARERSRGWRGAAGP
jgi:glycerol kinase